MLAGRALRRRWLACLRLLMCRARGARTRVTGACGIAASRIAGVGSRPPEDRNARGHQLVVGRAAQPTRRKRGEDRSCRACVWAAAERTELVRDCGRERKRLAVARGREVVGAVASALRIPQIARIPAAIVRGGAMRRRVVRHETRRGQPIKAACTRLAWARPALGKGLSAPGAGLGTHKRVWALALAGAAKGRPAARPARLPPGLELELVVVARRQGLDHVRLAARAVQRQRCLAAAVTRPGCPHGPERRGWPVAAAVLLSLAPQPVAARGQTDGRHGRRRARAGDAGRLPRRDPAVPAARFVGE